MASKNKDKKKDGEAEDIGQAVEGTQPESTEKIYDLVEQFLKRNIKKES